MDGRPTRTILLSVRYAAAGIARQALAVLLIPIYTLYLGPKEFGILALLTISGTLIVRTIETPVASALQRFYYRPDYRDRRDTFLFNLALFVGVNVSAVLGLYWLAARLLTVLLFDSTELTAAVRMHGLVVAFSATTSLLGALVLLLERSRSYVVASLLNVLVTGVVSVGLLAYGGMGVTAVIAGQAAGLLFQTALWLPTLRAHVRPKIDRNILREPLRFGYATLLSGYSNLLIMAGDRYVLRFLKTVQDVGLYSFACNIGNLVTLAIGTPVISGVWPTIRRMEEHPDAQRAFIRRVTTFVSAAGIGLALGISVFATELIRLLASRPEFAAAAGVVPLLAFAQALQGLAPFTEAGIVLGNKPRYVSGVALTCAAVNVGLNFLLIPWIGMRGAAAASLLSYAFWNLLNIHYSARFHDLHFDVRRLSHAIVVGGAIAAGAAFIPAEMNHWYAWPLKGLLVSAFPAALVATGFLNAEERPILAGLARGVRRRGIRGMMVALTQP